MGNETFYGDGLSEIGRLCKFVHFCILNDLDFDRYKVGSIKRSSCVGERMRASLNQLLN